MIIHFDYCCSRMPLLSLRSVITVMLAAAAGNAFACLCAPGSEESGGFLHLDRSGQIALPANALGVLFARSAETPTPVQTPLPTAGDFSIVDLHDRRTVPAVLTRLDSVSQMDRLGSSKAWGASVLRVTPLGGFVAGHSYEISYKHGRVPPQVVSQALVKVGPYLPVSPDDKFMLVRQGAASRELLTLPGPANACGEPHAAVVQRLQYMVPAARRNYARLLVSFTAEQVVPASFGFVPTGFEHFGAAVYRPSACPFADAGGTSVFGQGKDLVYAKCPDLRSPYPKRRVRGLAGMLELEDTLHPTDTLDVDFSDASGPYCWLLRRKAA
jgi:hypothetical protein